MPPSTRTQVARGTTARTAPGLLVVGVGRSGTSVACRVATMLGLRPPEPWDLMWGNHANVDGYWESTSLAITNDRALDAWGRTWWHPPASVTAAMLDAAEAAVPEARATFDLAFGTGAGWVWKDPRLTVTLPLWTRVVGEHPALLVHRRPADVAVSVKARDAVPLDRALALWERHTRLALRALEGRRVLVAGYDRLCEAPDAWVDDLLAFCAGAGLTVSSPSEPVATTIRPADHEADDAVTRVQRELDARLLELQGAYQAFPAVDVPPESIETAELVEAIALPSWWRPPVAAPTTADGLP